MREQRLEGLRAAARAHVPSWPDAATNASIAALARVVSQIRSSTGVLRDAASRARDSDAHQAALGMLDAGLDGFADEIRTRVDETPLEELLPRLASRAVPARSDLVDLLDLMIADESRLDARHERIDVLLLLLATDERNGRRQVVRDPATLTPALQALAARVAASDGEDLARVETEFVAAARRWLEDSSASDLAAMRARRAELGRRGFAPQAMRGIVFFHAATSDLQPAAPPVSRAPEGVHAPGPPSVSQPTRASSPTSAAPPTIASPRPSAAQVAPSATNGTAARSAPAARPPVVKWKIENAPPAPVSSPERGRMASRARRVTSTVALAACAVATILLWPANPDAAHVLSRQELQSVSTVLESAYRDGKRSGPLFVATVTTEWKRLSRAGKERSGEEIFAKLAPTGVRELMLYDSRNRLVLHQSTAFPTRIAD